LLKNTVFAFRTYPPGVTLKVVFSRLKFSLIEAIFFLPPKIAVINHSDILKLVIEGNLKADKNGHSVEM
jgi:hypothetical protein